MNLRHCVLAFLAAASLVSGQGSISSLSPASVTAGSSGITLSVNGSGFTSLNIVQFNGTNQTTTFASSTLLTAVVPASALTTAGVFPVRVKQNVLSLVFSNTVNFTVNNPVPVLTSISPASATAGAASFTLTATGSSFIATSVVRLNGAALLTTFTSATQLTATVSASLIATAGAKSITVFNATPGGGISATRTLTVNNPVPALSSINPIVTVALATPPTVTVTGGNFNSQSRIRVDGVDLATTTLLSSTQVSGTLTAAHVALPGQLVITVFNPAPGGGTSIPATMFISTPSPILTTVNPAVIVAGSPDTTITLAGSNFFANSVARWNGTDLTTTFLGNSSLQAVVPAAFLTTAGSFTVTVLTPLAGVSGPRTVTVENPVPIVTSLTPPQINPGITFILQVNGSGFVNGSQIVFNHVPHATTFFSPTDIRTTVFAASVPAPGTVLVHVVSPLPGGGASNSVTFNIGNPTPGLSSVSPTSVVRDGPAFTLTANGSGYVGASIVTFGGTALSTTFVSGSQLTAAVPAALIAGFTGAVPVAVVNPAPGGGTASGQVVNVINPLPAIATISPSPLHAGIGPASITVQGTGFIPGSVVKVSNTSLATTFVSSTEVQATVTAPILFGPGTLSMSVINPTPGGGQSSAFSLPVVWPAPILTSVSPTSVVAGGGTFTLSAIGSSFTTSSQISFNGTIFQTTNVNSGLLQASINGSLTLWSGPRTVQVFTQAPGGGSSAILNLEVEAAVPSLSSINPPAVSAGSAATFLQVFGSGFQLNTTVLAGGVAVPTNMGAGGQLVATIPASLLQSLGGLEIRATTPPPGGGTSSPLFVLLVNSVPTANSVSPLSFEAAASTVFTVTGSGFHTATVVLLDGAPMPTTFVSGSSVQGTLPAGIVNAPGAHAVAVQNLGAGGGLSGSLPVQAVNGVPVISSNAPAAIPAGLPNPNLALLGTGFSAQTAVLLDGVPVPATFVTYNQVDIVVPTYLAAATRAFRVRALNPAPGGGISAETFVLVDGPMITSFSPAVLTTGATAAVDIDVFGSGFSFGQVVRANGVPVPTGFIDSGHLQASLLPGLAELQIPGGVILSVDHANIATSNAKDLPVGNPVPPINGGTVILSPAPPAPGAAFTIRVETPVHSVPVTLIADIAQPAPVAIGVGPGSTLMLGVMLGLPVTLADGLGVFGPPDGSALRDGILPVNGPGNQYGVFELPFPAAPNPPIGITATLQAAYLDVSSPIGIRLTQALYPVSL